MVLSTFFVNVAKIKTQQGMGRAEDLNNEMRAVWGGWFKQSVRLYRHLVLHLKF